MLGVMKHLYLNFFSSDPQRESGRKKKNLLMNNANKSRILTFFPPYALA